MKGITEMTEQEILALTEEDVQKLIKLRMMEEGIKIMDKPEVPELFEIEPADLKVFTIPFFEGYAFTDMEEANAVAEALRNAKTLRKVEYDWNKLGSDYKYLVKKDKYNYSIKPDFEVNCGFVYSSELYEKMQEASGIISEISGRVKEVKVKYERLNRLTYKFATDYYPLSDHNEDMAMKFMAKAYSFTDKEKEYILQNYKELLSTSDE